MKGIRYIKKLNIDAIKDIELSLVYLHFNNYSSNCFTDRLVFKPEGKFKKFIDICSYSSIELLKKYPLKLEYFINNKSYEKVFSKGIDHIDNTYICKYQKNKNIILSELKIINEIFENIESYFDRNKNELFFLDLKEHFKKILNIVKDDESYCICKNLTSILQKYKDYVKIKKNKIKDFINKESDTILSFLESVNVDYVDFTVESIPKSKDLDYYRMILEKFKIFKFLLDYNKITPKLPTDNKLVSKNRNWDYYFKIIINYVFIVGLDRHFYHIAKKNLKIIKDMTF